MKSSIIRIVVIASALFTLAACQSAPGENEESARVEISYNPNILRPFPDDPNVSIRHSGPIDVEWYDEELEKAHRAFVAGGQRAENKPEILLEAERHLRRALSQPVRFGVSGNRLWIEPRGAEVNYHQVVQAFAGTGLFRTVQVSHLRYQ
ncbi:hypothetical protein CWE08_07685 [Aliidiomarina iranensis]|uniref:Lipoprotein n=1 Tax=Aliidiomarina iranensis TaxID=1434071 RepID=A0A432VWU5_9GAMM|nr:hypothetical protein [Aliidiomarina iranensis]RUO20974.1 hypothetical protein CWE08_07685 [Aliidiomarina iranensis]